MLLSVEITMSICQTGTEEFYMNCGLNHVSEVILATFDKPNASKRGAL